MTIEKYFNAERNESLVFIALGILAILIALYFLFYLKKPFYNGMAVPLMLIALIQVSVGSTIWNRSPRDMAKVTQIVDHEPARLSSEELPRMRTVMRNFSYYRWIEIVLVIAGSALFFLLPPGTFWRGIGFGLLIQSAIMLNLDLLAERRGKEYVRLLKSIHPPD